MAYANLPQDHDAKQKRGQMAMNHQEPDRVPTILIPATWGYGYTKKKVKELLPDYKKLAEYGSSPLKDIYTDYIIGGTLTIPLSVYDYLKPENPQYFISDDGYTMQHREISPMKPEEYGQLTANVTDYLENVVLPRRYPILTGPREEAYASIKGAYKEAMNFVAGMQYVLEYQRKEFGMPAFFGGNIYAPMDYLMDFLRGFRGVSVDMRRRPEEVKLALDALADFTIATEFGPQLKKGDMLWVPLHIPPFLSPKQFDEFYWPSFKKLLDYGIQKKGLKFILGLEGDWTPHLERLKEFPKSSLLGTIETTDIFHAKKVIGDHVTLIGGMNTNLLRGDDKEACINLTKKLVDECGPGGGYFFATDKMLMSPGDMKVENYIACVETILTYT